MRKITQYLNQITIALLMITISCNGFQINKKNDVITTPHPLSSIAGKEMFTQNGNEIGRASCRERV